MVKRASTKRALPELWIVRMMRGHAKLWCAVAAGIVLFVALPSPLRTVTRALIAWDAGLVIYLAAAAAMMARSSIADIRKHSAEQDEGAAAILVLIVVAALASLGAIFIHLAPAKQAGLAAWSYALAIATVILSWAFVHTIFALHYAHDFYGEGERANGLKFPDDDKPDYWDFVYFSFVVGMTFQVSDVAVTNKRIRRSVVLHGVLSFFFTTAVVALSVNMAANVF
jgi:uncharacterized membrane protein